MSRGFFTTVTVNLFLPDEIFSQVTDSSRSGELQSIDFNIDIKGFDLGHKLGKGLSGALIENSETFRVERISVSLSNLQKNMLSAIHRLNRDIKELLNHDEE